MAEKRYSIYCEVDEVFDGTPVIIDTQVKTPADILKQEMPDLREKILDALRNTVFDRYTDPLSAKEEAYADEILTPLQGRK